MRTRTVLLAVAALALFASPFARAQQKPLLGGEWKGQWTNSLGERGEDTLVLRENAAGGLQGTWSGTLAVSGTRVGARAFELRARTATREYRVTGSVEGDVLTLTYVARRLDAPGSYEGQSRMTRVGGSAQNPSRQQMQPPLPAPKTPVAKPGASGGQTAKTGATPEPPSETPARENVSADQRIQQSAGDWQLTNTWTAKSFDMGPCEDFAPPQVSFSANAVLTASTHGKCDGASVRFRHTWQVPPKVLKAGQALVLDLNVEDAGTVWAAGAGRGYTAVFVGSYGGSSKPAMRDTDVRIPGFMDMACDPKEDQAYQAQNPLWQGRPISFWATHGVDWSGKLEPKIPVQAAYKGAALLCRGAGKAVKKSLTITVPNAGGQNKFLLIIAAGHGARAQLYDSTGTTGAHGTTYYEYTTNTQPTSEPARANLQLRVTGGYPGSVIEGASCVLRVEGKERKLVTGQDGTAKDLVTVSPQNKSAVEWVRIELGSSARLRRLAEPAQTLYPGLQPWVFPINRTLTFPSGDNPILQAEGAAPVSLVQVSIVAWDKRVGAWQPTTANLQVYRGRTRVVRERKLVDLRVDQMGGQNPFRLWLPAPAKPDYDSLTFLAVSDPRNPMQAVRFVPALVPGDNVPRTLILGLAADGPTQFGFFLPDLRKLLTAAGLSTDDVTRIFAIPIRLGSRPYFDDRTRAIQLPANLDLSMDEPAATTFHEYVHAIMNVMGRNEGIPPSGKHDVFDVTDSGTAWDEGRAHFVGALIAEALGIPANLDSWGGANTGARRSDVEGQVANALADHFRNRKLYPDEKAAVQGFFQAQAAYARAEGHTPRSIQEFLMALQKTAPTSEQRADATRLLAAIR